MGKVCLIWNYMFWLMMMMTAYATNICNTDDDGHIPVYHILIFTWPVINRLWSWFQLTFASGTLNVKGKDSKRCHTCPVSLRLMDTELVPGHVHLCEGPAKFNKAQESLTWMMVSLYLWRVADKKFYPYYSINSRVGRPLLHSKSNFSLTNSFPTSLPPFLTLSYFMWLAEI